MSNLPKFKMPFEPRTIEHLGLRLYSTLPPVISELVSNSYDAEAEGVEISFPTGTLDPASEVVVKDTGHGMTAQEMQDEFLPISRPRRGTDGKNVMSKNGKVHVTGRKGLGKLAAFGVAKEIEIRSVRSKQAICLKLNYDEIQKWALSHPPGTPYEPEVIADRTGSTSEANGVEIRIRKFHRTKAISEDVVRRGLARRLNFIGRKFKVEINKTQIKPGDRVEKSDCPNGFSWTAKELPGAGKLSNGMPVSGWIGFLEESSQTERGVDVFANEKAVELGTFFNYASTHIQFARAHFVGEIHADFLDGEEDLAATARNSVIWESETGQAFQEWGQEALKWAFNEWNELRKKKKVEAFMRTADFNRWLETRQKSEQRAAEKLIKALINDPKIEAESAESLLDIIKSSIETKAFFELVDSIEESSGGAVTLLQLFDEWRVIEAREHMKLADGRMEAIEKLEQFIKDGALEVQQMQPLFEKHIWLINSTWNEIQVQPRYTDLLRKNCKEPKDLDEKDRRLDILGISVSGVLTVVELKRADKTLSKADLNQIESYVDWARKNIAGGTGDDSVAYVNGRIIVGKLNSAESEKVRRLAGDDIRVETYSDLHEKSRKYYDEIESRLKEIAPEYSRVGRKKRKSEKAKG